MNEFCRSNVQYGASSQLNRIVYLKVGKRVDRSWWTRRNHRVLRKGRWEGQNQREKTMDKAGRGQREREKLENAMLLTLKMEERQAGVL